MFHSGPVFPKTKQLTRYFNMGSDLGYSAGLQSAKGLNYKLKDGKFSLFGELNFSIISFRPSYKELLVNTRNGANQMGTLSQSQKLVEYVKEHSYLNNSNLGNTSRKEPIIHIPLSNFSLLVGVKYNFGK